VLVFVIPNLFRNLGVRTKTQGGKKNEILKQVQDDRDPLVTVSSGWLRLTPQPVQNDLQKASAGSRWPESWAGVGSAWRMQGVLQITGAKKQAGKCKK